MFIYARSDLAIRLANVCLFTGAAGYLVYAVGFISYTVFGTPQHRRDFSIRFKYRLDIVLLKKETNFIRGAFHVWKVGCGARFLLLSLLVVFGCVSAEGFCHVVCGVAVRSEVFT